MNLINLKHELKEKPHLLTKLLIESDFIEQLIDNPTEPNNGIELKRKPEDYFIYKE